MVEALHDKTTIDRFSLMIKTMLQLMAILICFATISHSQTVAEVGSGTLAVHELVASAKQYADENAAGLSVNEKDLSQQNKKKISSILDLHEMAHLILAKHWDNLKSADRERYSFLLSALVEKIGYPQIAKFFNGNIEIQYISENTIKGSKNVSVITKIVCKDDDVVLTSEFRLHPEADAWRIYDVITDGESLLLIYRNQHASIIKEKGFQHLIKLMEKKLNEAK